MWGRLSHIISKRISSKILSLAFLFALSSNIILPVFFFLLFHVRLWSYEAGIFFFFKARIFMKGKEGLPYRYMFYVRKNICLCLQGYISSRNLSLCSLVTHRSRNSGCREEVRDLQIVLILSAKDSFSALKKPLTHWLF